MERCEYWINTFVTDCEDGFNRAIPIQICNSTYEECACNGDPAKCNFRSEGKKGK